MLKNLLYIAILTTIVVASWIGFGIYHNSISSTISKDTEIKIIPISPSFETKTINALKVKKVIKVDLKEKINFPSITPKPSDASRSGTLQPTPTVVLQSTSSGQLNSGPGL